MLDIKIDYISARNFMCFGPEGIEINFKNYGNIVLIRGNNLDVQDEEERIASNGVGKSAIPEILSYTLYGKTIKHPKRLTHKNVINNQIGKNLRTEVRWGNYRVVRTRKPDSLRIWETTNQDWSGIGDEEWEEKREISRGGGIPATQPVVEEKIGLNYESFVNIVVFTDNNAGCFLECDGPTKREIVENLLSLDKYREFAETAKTLRNSIKDKIKNLARDYEGLFDDVENCKKREKNILDQESQWKKKKREEISGIEIKIRQKQEELGKTDEGRALSEYEEAQEKIKKITQNIVDEESRKSQLDDMLLLANQKLEKQRDQKQIISGNIQSCKLAIQVAEDAIKQLNLKIKLLFEQEGSRCDHCHAVVSKENYGTFVEQKQIEIAQYEATLKTKKNELQENEKQLTTIKQVITKITEAISTGNASSREMANKIAKLRNELGKLQKIERPEVDLRSALLQKEIETLKQNLLTIEEELKGPSPYQVILTSAKKETETKEQECKSKKEELEQAEKELPYYDFWVTAFGDSGIRKFVIDGIIPVLNSRVAHWMQFLIDGKITLEFNNEFDEIIQRNPPDGDPFVYPQMSRGEQRRLNLAVAQAFAHVRMLDTGRLISLVFLDEVSTNVDPVGVIGIYNMILELAKERQVFVTTHDQGLLDMLEGCDAIILQKNKGFSHILKS